MIQILPAILATQESDFAQKVTQVNSSPGLADGLVHIDIADNTFVKNQTVDETIIKKYPLNQKIELHLMVDDPAMWLERLSGLQIERAIAHSEISTENITKFLQLAKAKNITVGLALNPDTPLQKIELLLQQIEIILVMGVVPGFSGQEFITTTPSKVKESKERSKCIVGVDGGMNIESAKLVIEAGADYIAMANALLYGDIDENLEKIWEALR